MRNGRRTTLLVVAPILLAVAVLGFLSGHSPVAGVEATREATTPFGSLDYPSASGWRPASPAGVMAGLEVQKPFVLAPNGDSSRAGLLVGHLDSNPGPIPAGFLARLRQVPTAELVYLTTARAYRYWHVGMLGSDRVLTLYAIPSTNLSQTAIVCYAPATALHYLGQCERIAASFIAFSSFSGEGLDLTPDLRYAGRIRAVVQGVDNLRAALRGGIRPQAPRATAQDLATRLAAGMAAAAESLSALQPPRAARRAHAALSESLRQASAAYSALAAAVANGGVTDYAAARARIYDAEAHVDGALVSLALLGYK